MLLFSWDNLSTKGTLHVAPDLMFVWNERQRREAAELHDYPPERVADAAQDGDHGLILVFTRESQTPGGAAGWPFRRLQVALGGRRRGA
jgi:hypothetical protein